MVVLVIASVVGLVDCSHSSMAVTQESEDKELRALLTARREALKSVMADHVARFQQGTEDSPANADLVMELMHVDLELARTKNDRIAIIESSLETLVEREKFVEAKVKASLSSSTSLSMAKADRLKLEIELHKARKAP
jgi:hypothetical protein